MSQPVCREYKKMTTYIHITSEYEVECAIRIMASL